MASVLISDERYAAYQNEFFFILKKYILPLLPVKVKPSVLPKCTERQSEPSQYNRLINYDSESGTLTIVPIKKNPAFVIKIDLPQERGYSFKAIEAILTEISSVTLPKTVYEPKDEEHDGDTYESVVCRLFDDNFIYLESITDVAFEKGLSGWLGGTDACGHTIFRLLHKLSAWTRKTYEGRRVSFGVVIDKEAENGNMDYISFLNNRNSALVSDGIFSAVYLDKNGRLIKSISTDFRNDQEMDDPAEILAPYEYARFAELCKDNKIGIVALASGDILIMKDCKLIFGKRNDEWGLFDHENIMNEIYAFVSEDLEDPDRTRLWECRVLAREIYKTLIDVSFSYTGGCIGIVKNMSGATRLIDKNKITYEEFAQGKYDPDYSDPDMISGSAAERRLAIANLLWYDGKMRGFAETNRKLRMECAAFDGAMIIDVTGKYITVGSIVKVDGGGTGGRTLAARSLAKVGMGIKISSDGDITAYKGKDCEHIFSIN